MAKTDQPGLIELHAEKIALALSAVIMLVVGYLWVYKSPNVTTEVGTAHEPVPPAEIDPTLLATAEQVRSQIESLPAEEYDPDPADEKLRRRLANPLGHEPPESLVPITEGPAGREMAEGPIGGKDIDAMPELPPLDELDVWIGHESIAEASRQGRMMTGGTVKDVTVAHVTAVLDYEHLVNTWQQALNETGTPLDIRFVRVVALRQKRQSDGDWGPSEEIETARATDFATGADTPGVGLLELPTYTGKNYPEVRAALDALAQRGVQQAILQPDYPRVYWPEAKGFGGWMHHLPPTSVSNLEDAIFWPNQEPDTSGLAVDMRSLRTTRRESERDRRTGPGPGTGTDMYGRGGRTAGAGTDMYDPTGGTMYDPTGGTGGARATRRPTGRTDATEARRAQAERAVQQALEALEEADEALRAGQTDDALGLYERAERFLARASEYDAGAGNISEAMRRVEEGKRRAQLPVVTRLPLLGNMCQAGKIQLWLHDNTCEPGEVYRYKLRLEVCNPLFIHITPTTREDDAPTPVLETTSDWSEPIQAPRRTEFFLTDAAGDGMRITIFRRTYGQVLAQKVTVSVGDPIGSVESRPYLDLLTRQPAAEPLEVDFSTGYILVDFDDDKTIAPRGVNRKTAQATLLAPDGTLVTRTVADDRGGSRYRQLARDSREAEQQLDQLAQPLRP